MKNGKKKIISMMIAAAALILMLCMTVFAQEAQAKTDGLKKTKKTAVTSDGTSYTYYKTCYYKNGRKVKNRWVTVKGYRYYFNSKGWACTGARTVDTSGYGKYLRYYSLKKIRSSVYAFDEYGRMLKGVQAIATVKIGRSRKTGIDLLRKRGSRRVTTLLYYFNRNGKLNKSRTTALNKLSKQNADYRKLNRLLTRNYGYRRSSLKSYGPGCSTLEGDTEVLTDYSAQYKKCNFIILIGCKESVHKYYVQEILAVSR